MPLHAPEFTDTRAMEMWLAILREKTPGERIGIAFDLSEMAFQMAESGVACPTPGSIGT